MIKQSKERIIKIMVILKEREGFIIRNTQRMVSEILSMFIYL